MSSMMPCPVCDGMQFQPVFWRSLESPYLLRWGRRPPDSRAEADGRIIQKCLDCGFVSVNPVPSEEELARFYGEDFYTNGLAQNTIIRWGGYTQPYETERSRRETLAFNQSLLGGWESTWRNGNAVTHPPKYLDVGCGTGLLVDAGRALGWSSHGAEISDYGYGFARDRLGLDIFHGPLEAAEFPAESFDIVSVIGVLEHVSRPHELLAEIARILKPGGLIVVEVPNDLHSFRNLLFPKKWWMVPPIHLNYFARDSLTRILANANLQVVRIRSKGFGHNQVYNDAKVVMLYELRNLLKPNRYALRPVQANGDVLPSATPRKRPGTVRSAAITIDIFLGRHFLAPDWAISRLDLQSELLGFARKGGES